MNIRDFEVPEEDRAVVAKVMAFLSAVDGEISLEEKQVMDDIIFAWKLDQKDIEAIYDILNNGGDLDNILSEINNARTPYLLIQELVTLSHLDGTYSESEKKTVNKISSTLNVSSARLADIEQWVIDGMFWRRRGLELIKIEEV